MSEFSQNGIISTLHDFGTRSTTEIEKDLLKFSKERKMELILPCLYSELEGNALPNIVEEISKTKYLDHIIVGLDKANEKQAKKAWKFFKKLKTPFSLLWNDGPELKKLDKELKKKICHQVNSVKAEMFGIVLECPLQETPHVQLLSMIVTSKLTIEGCWLNFFIQL